MLKGRHENRYGPRKKLIYDAGPVTVYVDSLGVLELEWTFRVFLMARLLQFCINPRMPWEDE